MVQDLVTPVMALVATLVICVVPFGLRRGKSGSWCFRVLTAFIKKTLLSLLPRIHGLHEGALLGSIFGA